MHKGRISAEHREAYRILVPAGEIEARISGRFRHRASSRLEYPAVGDWVSYTIESGGTAIVHEILPRSCAIVRKAAGTALEEQILAANVDTLFVVCGLDADFNVRRIERYVALARSCGTRPVVLLNKVDICTHLDRKLEAIEHANLNLPLHLISAANGDGLEELAQYLQPGATVVLAGSSGAGKSTLTNALLGEVAAHTGNVRSGDDRGRHTTTSRQLFALPSGAFLVDTPGMRELQLWEAGDAVSETFGDIEELASQCRFRDCAHEREPGCAVRSALGVTLEEARLESYRKLLREQAFLERKLDTRAALAEKERWKKIHRDAQADYRFRKGR